MERIVTTTDEQDAALAWRVAQLQANGEKATESQLIARFANAALGELVAAFRDSEAARVFDAFKGASLDDRKSVKEALNL